MCRFTPRCIRPPSYSGGRTAPQPYCKGGRHIMEPPQCPRIDPSSLTAIALLWARLARACCLTIAVLVGLLTAAMAATAQPPKVYRIGFLASDVSSATWRTDHPPYRAF